MTAFGMTQEDRIRLRTAIIVAVGFYLVLFLAMLGLRPPTGGPSAEAGGTAISVELEGNPQVMSASHGEGASLSGSSAGNPSTESSATSGGSMVASSGQAQSVPANPFALPAGIDLSGDVVAASSGALEANRVTYGSRAANPAAPPPAVPQTQPISSAASGSAPVASAQPIPKSAGPREDSVASPGGTLPSGGVANGGIPAASGTSTAGGRAAATGGGEVGGKAQPNVFDQAILAFALGQQSAGYAGGGGSGPQSTGGGSGEGASTGGQAGLLSAPGASGDGGFPIEWATSGGRLPESEPPPLDLSKYSRYLPPRAVVWVKFDVSPSGYVTPLQLIGSSGNTVVDNLLLGWMGKWKFSPVRDGTSPTRGSLKYIIQATTAR